MTNPRVSLVLEKTAANTCQCHFVGLRSMVGSIQEIALRKSRFNYFRVM